MKPEMRKNLQKEMKGIDGARNLDGAQAENGSSFR